MKRIAQEIKEQNIKTLYFCHSFIHILNAYMIYSLTKMNASDIGFIILVLDDTDESILKRIDTMLRQQGIAVFHIMKGSYVQRVLGISDMIKHKEKRSIYNAMSLNGGDFLLVNFSWNQEYVYYPASIFFKDASKVIFIEEGSAQYAMPHQKKLMLLFRKIYSYYPYYWKMKKMVNIYVQNPEKYNVELWDYLTKCEMDYSCVDKAAIDTCMKMFLSEQNMSDIERYKNSDSCIIFTQPLSEDGYISEKEKMQIYSTLVDYYSRNNLVVVKRHPRDNSDYSMLNCILDAGKYPCELLNILGIHFKYAIGVSTSAVFSVEADNIVNINEDFLTDKVIDLDRFK